MAYRDADGENPFTIPPFHRPFRVIVDDDSAEAGAALALLTAFADRPGVRVYRTSTTSRTRVEILPPNESSDYVPIDYVDAEGTVEMAVPAVESWRRSTSMTIEEFGGEPEQVFRELVLAQAASRHDIDLLVTGATAHDAPMWRRFRADANVAEPRTACALLGLYLRAHGDFTVRVGQVTNFSRSGALLPGRRRGGRCRRTTHGCTLRSPHGASGRPQSQAVLDFAEAVA